MSSLEGATHFYQKRGCSERTFTLDGDDVQFFHIRELLAFSCIVYLSSASESGESTAVERRSFVDRY